MKIEILDVNKAFQNLCFGENIKNLYRKVNALLRDFDGIIPYMNSFLAHSSLLSLHVYSSALKMSNHNPVKS